MTPLQQRTLQVAKRFIGVREDLGPNRGTVVQKFQRFIGNWMLGQPWCIAFLVFCCRTAAKELGVPCKIPMTASSSHLFRWAKQHGALLAGPEPGCIGLVRAGGRGDDDGRSNRGASHIHGFLVHDVQGTEVVTVEGNMGNAVRWGRRLAKRLDYVRIG